MNVSEKGFLLHIGMPKTGTTTLQILLFRKHPEIHLFGKCGTKIPRECLSIEIYKFLKPLIWNLKWPLNVEKHKAMLRKQILPGVDHNKHLVGSWEGLVRDSINRHKKRIYRLRSVFGSFRIMMTIRNPLTQIPSYYLQTIKGNFIYRDRPWMGKLPYIDIDEWLKRKISTNKSLDDLLSYSKVIQKAVDLLGKENVGVFVFEDMISDPEKYYGGICDFIGIDKAQGLELTRQRHLNQRITQNQIEYLMRLNDSSIWHQVYLKMCGRHFRRRQLEAKTGDGIRARVSLSPKWEKEISNLTRAGNRWLAENYLLGLSEYGYPL
jgi:hypothetical protein